MGLVVILHLHQVLQGGQPAAVLPNYLPAINSSPFSSRAKELKGCFASPFGLFYFLKLNV